MVGIAYQTCVEVSLGSISVIFHAVWQKVLPGMQFYIKGCIDFVSGNVSGVTKMLMGG